MVPVSPELYNLRRSDLYHTTSKALKASIQAVYNGDLVSLASAIASVSSSAATVADVPLVKPFYNGFCRASSSENAVSRRYFSSTFPRRLVIVILLYEFGS